MGIAESTCAVEGHVWKGQTCSRCGARRLSPVLETLQALTLERVQGSAPTPGSLFGELLKQPTPTLGQFRDRLEWFSVSAESSTQALIAVLANSGANEDEAVRAVPLLAAREGAQALPHLVRALGDRKDSVRRAAAEALGKLAHPDAVEPLVALLSDGRVGSCAAAALAAIGDARAVEPLCHALTAGVNDVPKSAAEALARFRDPRAVEPLLRALDDGTGSVRRTALDALASLGDPRAIEPLIGRLTHPDPELRKALAAALGACGEPTWAELVRGEANDLVRLAASPDPRGAAAVIRGLDAPLAWTRAAAAEALGQSREALALDRLVARLDDRDDQVATAAAAALAKLGDPRALDPLGRALGSGGRSLQLAAVAALGDLGGSAAAEQLLPALGDADAGIRLAAAAALHRLGQPEWAERVRGGPEDPRWLADAGDPRAVAPLLRALGHLGPVSFRAAAAEGLGRLGDPRAAELLLEACAEQWEELARAAAEALGMLGTGAVQPLARALESDRPGAVRLAAARALGRIGDLGALEPLARTLRAEPLPLVERAAAALVKLGSGALVPLSAALAEDPRGEVKALAAEALGELGDRGALRALKEAAGATDELVRRRAVAALGRLGDPRALDTLVTAMQDQSADVATSAAEALGRLGDRRALKPLVAALGGDRRWLSRQAAAALGQLGDPAATPALVEALYGGDGSLHAAAAEALRALGGWAGAQDQLRSRPLALGMLVRLLRGLDVAGEGVLAVRGDRGLTLRLQERGLTAAATAAALAIWAADLAELPAALCVDDLYQLADLRFPGEVRNPTVLSRQLSFSREPSGDQVVLDVEKLLVIRNGQDSYAVYRSWYHRVMEDRWV